MLEIPESRPPRDRPSPRLINDFLDAGDNVLPFPACAEEFVECGDGPPAPAALAGPQLNQFQLQLIELSRQVDAQTLVALLPREVREAQEAEIRRQIRDRYQRSIDAAIAGLQRNINAESRTLFPDGVQPLPEFVITRLRELIQNNQLGQVNALRDRLVDAEFEATKNGELANHFTTLVRREAEAGNFGPYSRALYGAVAQWMERNVYTTLQRLDDRLMEFPPGCPIEPPRSPLGNRHVSDELFRAMIRAMRPGQPGSPINFRLPELGEGGVPNVDQFAQFENALNWMRRANEALAPIDRESRYDILSRLIASERINRPGWARPPGADAEQWYARASTMVDLEQQMRACAELMLTLHQRFPDFPLTALQEANFPGQIEIRDGRLVRFRPALPDNLDNTFQNRQQIDRCLEWLRTHGQRVQDLIARLVSAEDDRPNIFMLGDVEPEPGQPRTVGPDNRPFNLITHDFEAEPANDGTGRIRVTSLTRYRNSPFYNYQNVGDFTVHTVRGDTVYLQPDELIMVFRNGRLELMRADQMASWRTNHQRWWWAGFALTAAIDLSMIVSGTIELRAAWTAAGQLMARAGSAAMRSYIRRCLVTQLARGTFHVGLGASGILTSSYFGDHNGLGPSLRTTRHALFVADALHAITGGAVVGRLTQRILPSHRAFGARMNSVIAEYPWFVRAAHAFGHASLADVGRGVGAGRAIERMPWLMRAGLENARVMPAAILFLIGSDAFGTVRDRLNRNGTQPQARDLLDLRHQQPHFERFGRQVLGNLNLPQDQTDALLGIVADNRNPPPNPPVRRLNVEAQLIQRYNAPGATDQQRLAAAALLLLESGRNSPDGQIPAQLGEGGNRITSRAVLDFVIGRFRDSTDPAVRLEAARVLVACNRMSGQEFATFCMQVANDNAAPREVRARAVQGVAMSLVIAQQVEADLQTRIANGTATEQDRIFYLSESYGATRADLERFLQGMARRSGLDPDLRALSAATIHAVNHTDPALCLTNLQTVSDRWTRLSGQPAGSFAQATVAEWAQDLALPVDSRVPAAQRRQNSERMFMAASALGLLSDEAFRPIFLRANIGAAAAPLMMQPELANPGGLAGALRLLQAVRPLTPESINDALIACVNPSSPEAAAQALRMLINRLNAPGQGGIARLTPDQITRLRQLVFGEAGREDLLTSLALAPEGATDEQRREQAMLRQQVIRMLPELFRDAPQAQINRLLIHLGATLGPGSGTHAQHFPEVRAAAAEAIGRLMEGRPIPAITPSPIARLETALRTDPSPDVRIAALEALVRARPATLSEGRTLQQVVTQLLETERDPAVLRRLRSAEFGERTVDPTSPDYIDDFQRARRDLLLSLNARGERSLAGMPAWIRQYCSREETISHLNRPHQVLNSDALRRLALGTDANQATNALKALTYIIVSNGRPFEHHTLQAVAFSNAVDIMRDVARGTDPRANPQRARDVLWALEMCLVLQPQLSPGARQTLLEEYLALVGRSPENAALRQRAAVVCSIVLQREFTSGSRGSIDLQVACLTYLRDNRTRAALPVLELMNHANEQARTNPTTYTALSPRIMALLTPMLTQYRADPTIVAPGTTGGPRPGSVAFDDEFESLQRQLLDSSNGIFARPGYPIRIGGVPGRPDILVPPEPFNVQGTTRERRELMRAFADGHWFMTNNFGDIWHSYNTLGTRPGTREDRTEMIRLAAQYNIPMSDWEWTTYDRSGFCPAGAFARLIHTAQQDGSSATGAARERELRLQREARIALAWIVANNGEGIVHWRRDEFVRRAAEVLANLSARRVSGIQDIDQVIEAALAGMPLMSQDREVRNHLITALINRTEPAGSISRQRASILLTAALQNEYQTMPRPGEPGYDMSLRIQTRILEQLETLGHRNSAPVVEAIMRYHPNADIQARARRTLIALMDNVMRVWNRTVPDTTTAAPARATALRTALDGNGTHDGIVQAMFSAARGLPITQTTDPRYPLFVQALGDRRDHVRLAAALVVLRSENSGFAGADRQRAIAIAANAALTGLHIGLRESGRQILLDNLPNGDHTIRNEDGSTTRIIKDGSGLTVVREQNGLVRESLGRDGRIQRFIYDDQNRLTRYVAPNGTEYNVVAREGNQLTWEDPTGNRFYSWGEVVRPGDAAVFNGLRFRIARHYYPDGRYREFRYDGDSDTLIWERGLDGTTYQRLQDGGRYIDQWSINGDPARIWTGRTDVRPTGAYSTYYLQHHQYNDVTPYGMSSWRNAGGTFNLGSGRVLTVGAEGGYHVRVNGRFENVTVNLGGGRTLEQFEGGGSIMRENGRIIEITYPPGSTIPWRRFTYNTDGSLQTMTFRHTDHLINTVYTRVAGNRWRMVGTGLNGEFTGELTNTNGVVTWTGTDGNVQYQSIRTGRYRQGRPPGGANLEEWSAG